MPSGHCARTDRVRTGRGGRLGKDLFDNSVCPLSLTVGLGIKITRVAPFDAEELAGLTADFGHQPRLSTRKQ